MPYSKPQLVLYFPNLLQEFRTLVAHVSHNVSTSTTSFKSHENDLLFSTCVEGAEAILPGALDTAPALYTIKVSQNKAGKQPAHCVVRVIPFLPHESSSFSFFSIVAFSNYAFILFVFLLYIIVDTRFPFLVYYVIICKNLKTTYVCK